jgi:hypothetical protein
MLLRVLKSLFERGGEERQEDKPDSLTRAPQAGSQRAQRISMGEELSRLASFASGRAVQAGGMKIFQPAEPGDPAEASASAAAFRTQVMEVVAHASRLTGHALSAESQARVDGYARLFSAAAPAGSGLNVFAFHVDLADASELRYFDVHLKVGDFDYLDILRRLIGRIREHCAGATVYLVTSPGARYAQLVAPDVRVVELSVNKAQPMYERANALLAYASSAAFSRDTVFLDSDALVNRPLDEVFSLGFDVGLTYRSTSGLMPVNEGVIFLCAQRPQAVREFLRRRLATYDRLVSDPLVMRCYGDVRRWRGGQLSLNAVSPGLSLHSPYRYYHCAGAVVRMLPCDTFNFTSGEGEAATSLEHLDDRYIIHFKGMRKYAFNLAAKAERKSAAKP